jgi:hypothetical protein
VSLWSKILKIKFFGSTALFYIDDYLLDTQSYAVNGFGLSSFPSLGVVLKKTVGTDAAFFSTDWIELIMKKSLAGDYNEDFNEDYYI